MKIDKLTRIFDALGQGASSQSNEKAGTATDAGAQQSAEAVNVSSDFGAAGSQDQAARNARVQELKKQVDSKTYNPDIREVAKSVLEGLFA